MSKKTADENTHFYISSQSPSPQAPWDPSPEQELVLAVPGVVPTALYDEMAPQLCLFEISNFDVFLTSPTKTRFGTLGFTGRRKGNLPFFIFFLFLPNDLTIAQFPFLRPVI